MFPVDSSIQRLISRGGSPPTITGDYKNGEFGTKSRGAHGQSELANEAATKKSEPQNTSITHKAKKKRSAMAKNEKLIRLLQHQKIDFPFEMKMKSSRLSHMPRPPKKSNKQALAIEPSNYENNARGLSQPLAAYLPKRHTQSVGKVRQPSLHKQALKDLEG